ncbi:HEPN domain-containing protein [Hufsiella ginkgonis]|uniref:HEPN domain-containing protein n=1 Tax=Hufsiella ginkgonis TaxID=2695274 RepID=A0A7K1XS10_9SPHI|nr:HEPN domain-containing protein [Hufsiella ginkgonis]MXV13773.1 HEPN domain-containing protein [Hufsiella ginkgonis]
MKTSIAHLPSEKQQELSGVLEAILQVAKPVMVILFGSFSRGDWVEDRYVENGTTYTYKSDFDILVVFKQEKHIPSKMAKGIRQTIGKRAEGFTPLSMIFHGIDFLNKELEEGNYFFADIVKEGTMLYDSGSYQLAAVKELLPEARAKKGKMYFDSWFDNGNKFLKGSSFYLSEGDYKQAIFLLHQATESFYMAIILVFTDYKPKTHELDILSKEARMLDKRFQQAFPQASAEEVRLFDLLKRSYIDSRYKMGYVVAKEGLDYLAERVKRLKELTEQVCLEKIEQLRQAE